MEDILAFTSEIVKQIQQLLSNFELGKQTTLDEIETTVRNTMLEIGRKTVQKIINNLGTGYVGKEVTTPTGETAKYVGDREKTVKTLMGQVTIRRAYYYSDSGGYVPLDESLSIPKGSYSYAVQEAMSLLSTEDSFQEGEKKLSYLFPIDVSDSTIRRVAYRYGREVFEQEESEVKAVFSCQREIDNPKIEGVSRGYVSIDGVMVRLRDGYREMKVSSTYDTPPVEGAIANNLYYKALFANSDSFGEHLWVMLKKRGILDGKESIWVCDGARWEWKLKEEHDPEGKEILDFIHAVERLKEVGYEIHGEGTEESNSWIEEMKSKLMEEGGYRVLEELQELSGEHRGEKLQEVIEYYRNNINRMDYPRYKSEGYHTTSSTVESACRHVVGDRLKRSGMSWSQEGAQYITCLRLLWKNGEWKEFWKKYRPSINLV